MNDCVLVLAFTSLIAPALLGGCSSSTVSSSGSGGVECYALAGTGSEEECTYAYGNSTCGGPEKSGPCPAMGLVGCCGVSGTGGSCYYGATAAESESKSTCSSSGGTWSTTAP